MAGRGARAALELAEGMKAALAGLAVMVVAAGCGGTKTVTVTQSSTTVRTVTVTTTTTTTTGSAGPAACTGADLEGRFAVVPGSAGAGNIVYELRLTNTSASPCVEGRVKIYQNFQQIELEGRLAGREIKSSAATLIGREIAWEADGLRFRGRLQGDILSGELVGPDRRQPLILQRSR